MLIIPKIGSKGFYASDYDYSIKPKVVYTLLKVESFSSLLASGIDLLSVYYLPVGLTETDFDEDVKAGASILTISGKGSDVKLPNTRLSNYPIANIVNYSRVVLSLDLGRLPDELALDHISEELKLVSTGLIGNASEVRVHKLELDEAIDMTEHERLEAARKLAVVQSDNVYVQLNEALDENTKLRAKIARLETYIRS